MDVGIQAKTMSDYAESATIKDTDGDGFNDRAEICGGFDLLSPGSAKITIEQQSLPKPPSCTQ